MVVETYLITLSTEADIFQTFQQDGIKLIQMLEGAVVYVNGMQVYQ